MICPKCQSENTREIIMETGPHYAKLVCVDCGRWIKWVPKPWSTS